MFSLLPFSFYPIRNAIIEACGTYMYMHYWSQKSFDTIRNNVARYWQDSNYQDLNSDAIIRSIMSVEKISRNAAKLIFDAITTISNKDELLNDPSYSLPDNFKANLKDIAIGATLDTAIVLGGYYTMYTSYMVQISLLGNAYQVYETGNVTFIEAWKFTNYYQIQAFLTGKVTAAQALELKNSYQTSAIKLEGVTFEEALEITNDESFHHIHKAKKTSILINKYKATIEQVSQFNANHNSYWALKTDKATIEQALRITNVFQYHALASGKATVEQALRITNEFQYHALTSGKATAEKAIETTTREKWEALDKIAVAETLDTTITNTVTTDISAMGELSESDMLVA